MNAELWTDLQVAVRRIDSAHYDLGEVEKGLRGLSEDLGWGDAGSGALAEVIPNGARVLVKPNWVLHHNQGEWGVEPLLTHATLIRAVTEAALAAGAGEVIVGDAPLQACDFNALVDATQLSEWAHELSVEDPRFRGLHDFRRTACVMRDGVRTSYEDLRPESDFVLFDLGEDSLLEPISIGEPQFRVTQYDPRLLEERHRPGRHQYLIARQAIEADLVINLPKLKTHKKAGMTCALKNLIGINGNKEFLPHHRVGGSATGGDCYEGGGSARLTLEKVMDRYNMAGSRVEARLWHKVARAAGWVARKFEGTAEIEGAWSGNDTIWRTCLDLNRVLLYGRPDGTMADVPQRKEIHIVDAIIAGQGDGPLSPQPLPLGLLLAGASAAALDRVGAELLHYDPDGIPIVREAFGSFRWPLVAGSPSRIRITDRSQHGTFDPRIHYSGTVRHPPGWQDAAASQSPGNRGQ